MLNISFFFIQLTTLLSSLASFRVWADTALCQLVNKIMRLCRRLFLLIVVMAAFPFAKSRASRIRCRHFFGCCLVGSGIIKPVLRRSSGIFVLFVGRRARLFVVGKGEPLNLGLRRPSKNLFVAHIFFLRQGGVASELKHGAVKCTEMFLVVSLERLQAGLQIRGISACRRNGCLLCQVLLHTLYGTTIPLSLFPMELHLLLQCTYSLGNDGRLGLTAVSHRFEGGISCRRQIPVPPCLFKLSSFLGSQRPLLR